MILTISYVVHSDTNENNVLDEFFGRGCKQEAIAYAKRWAVSDPDDFIWVDKVFRTNSTEEVVDVEKCIWSSDEIEEELQEYNGVGEKVAEETIAENAKYFGFSLDDVDYLAGLNKEDLKKEVAFRKKHYLERI